MTEIVLGTAQLGMRYGIANRRGQPSADEAIALIRLAEAEKVDALDVAPAYGAAEALVGRASVSTPIFTKCANDDISASVRSSLSKLGRSSVDVLFLHEPQLVVHDPDGRIDRAASLVGTLVGRLGASVYSPAEFEACLADPRISCIQAPISAADRRLLDSGLLADAASAGKRVYARSVFLQGALLLAGSELPSHLLALRPLVSHLGRIASEAGVPLAELLPGYVAQLPGVAGVLIGCESHEQMVADVRGLRRALPGRVAEAIAALPGLAGSVVDPRLWAEPVVRAGHGASR